MLIAACGVCVIVGLAIAGNAVRNIYYSVSSDTWPTAQGQVVSSEIRSVSGSKGGSASPRPEIKYRFSVNGGEYWGDRITFGYARDTQDFADAMTVKYPRAAYVTVRYHPSDPYLNCLETGGSMFGHVLVIIFGLILSGLGVLPLIFKLPSRFGNV